MVSAGIGLREHDQGARDAAVRDELLGPVEHVLVAVFLGAGLHGRGVGAAARLGQRVGRDLFPRGQRGAEPLLLLLGSRDQDRVRAEGLDREDQG